MIQYASWKYVALIIALIFGVLYAAPNVFGDDPAVQIQKRDSSQPMTLVQAQQAEQALKQAGLAVKSAAVVDGQLVVRMQDTGSQLKALDQLKKYFGKEFVVAPYLAPRTPQWLRSIGAEPMPLGLDLRGGVHFLLQVDIDAATKNAIERYDQDIRMLLRNERLRYMPGENIQGVRGILQFRDSKTRDAAMALIASEFPALELQEVNSGARPSLSFQPSEKELKRIAEFAMTQSLTTLRNRVNELGVAEPVVLRQGKNRIVIQLPGVQNTTRAKEILGATATLEYRLVAEDKDAQLAAKSGVVPVGTQLYRTRDGRPVLLKRDVITTGDHIVDASSGIDTQSGTPAVFVTLDGQGARRMLETTTQNINKRMAVLFLETRSVTEFVDGKKVRKKIHTEEVINDAVIRGAFGRRFQTTGLQANEARDLALLLRAGALPAPLEIVAERTVGPSLGADNIERGFDAAMLGLALVAAFMAFYYRVFGLFAIAALTLNLILIVAALSLLQATLTMPGIAGIILTMGIAVDANVLIYERIREEMRLGATPHAAIIAGYDRAFLTIADANITVLMGTLLLFMFGAGPVKGFAVTLGLGIVFSQFTAVVGSRALAQLVFGKRKRMTDLPIW